MGHEQTILQNGSENIISNKYKYTKNFQWMNVSSKKGGKDVTYQQSLGSVN